MNAAEHHQVELTRQNAASKGWRVGRTSVAIAIAIAITVAIAIAITAMATIAIPSHVITAIVWHMAGVAVPVAVQVWPLIVKILTTIVTTTTTITITTITITTITTTAAMFVVIFVAMVVVEGALVEVWRTHDVDHVAALTSLNV